MKSRWEKLRAGRWKESESTKGDGTPTSTSLSPRLARQKCYVRTEHTWTHRCSSQLRDVVLELFLPYPMKSCGWISVLLNQGADAHLHPVTSGLRLCDATAGPCLQVGEI